MRQLNIRMEPAAVFSTWGTKPYPLGTRGHAPDGRVFRLAKAGGTALLVGRTAQAALPDPRTRDVGVTKNSTASIDDNTLKLEVGNMIADVTKPVVNAYEEGLLYIVSGGGAGYVYRIESSGAGDTVNGTIDVTLDSNEKAGDAEKAINHSTTRVTLLKNRFTDLAITDSPPKTAVIGATPTAVAANYYFWLQTHGACAVMQEGQTEIYRPIAASRVTQGAVHLATTTVPDLDTVGRQHYNTDGLAVVSVIRPGDRDAERLAPISGVGVVPDVQLGYVLDEGADGAFALVHLTVEV